MRVGILNLGLSNLFSIASAIKRLEVEVTLLEKPDNTVDAFIFPGVGNFTEAARRIEGIRGEMIEYIRSGRPFLGICLGMQILFDSSDEGPGMGLKVFRGRVTRLRASKLPHMGWNRINLIRPAPLTDGIQPGEYVYFMHSYAPQPVDERIVIATTSYQTDFPSIIGERAVYGTQFHPEKSGRTGEKILRNFIRIAKQ